MFLVIIGFLNNVIINETKVLLPQPILTILFTFFGLLLPNIKLFGFPIFRFLAYLLNIITETRRAH